MCNKKQSFYASRKLRGDFDWSSLFPRRPAGSIFVGFVWLKISQGFDFLDYFIVLSNNYFSCAGLLNAKDYMDDNEYNSTTVLFLIELLKLAISICFYAKK